MALYMCQPTKFSVYLICAYTILILSNSTDDKKLKGYSRFVYGIGPGGLSSKLESTKSMLSYCVKGLITDNCNGCI